VENRSFIVKPDDPILVTGAGGFIGPAVVASLLRHGFRNLRLFVRPSSDTSRLDAVIGNAPEGKYIEWRRGNLLSRSDCVGATKDVAVVIHLATGGSDSHAAAVMNSVVTTRNLLDAVTQSSKIRRFVNVSSFAVYSNTGNRVLDESGPLHSDCGRGTDAYTFAKMRQDQLVFEYGGRMSLPYVIVRPGAVFGPGKDGITGRVGVGTFGLFLHLGGGNRVPFTYIDNCADAIVLAASIEGVDGEIFNVVDDTLPSSRRFLGLYKKNVRRFPSIYVPHCVSYTLCWMWEWYSRWSERQLPPTFTLARWNSEWRYSRYSNQKLKTRLGWVPSVSMSDGLERYFSACRGSDSA
jgi:nucleoside-diphosphate-sugar epimerase